MSAQVKKQEEANTPEVNLVSLVVGTTLSTIESFAPQKQKKAEQQRAAAPLAPEDIAHRKGFWEFVEKHGAPWHKQHLGRLLELWLQWNQEHYASALTPPYILLSEPSEPKRYGDCARISGFGARSQIRIRPSLLRGTHPCVRPGRSYAEGRFLFVADVLLHEMIHQHQQEVTGKTEGSYHGHGPMFRDIANEIGEKLGLSMVRTSKNRGKEKDLPSCSQWPHCVRPDDFYQVAYTEQRHQQQSRIRRCLPLSDHWSRDAGDSTECRRFARREGDGSASHLSGVRETTTHNHCGCSAGWQDLPPRTVGNKPMSLQTFKWSQK